MPEYHHQMKGMGEWDGRRRRKPRMDGFVSGEIVYSSKIEWEIDFFPKDVVFISAHPGEHAAKKNGGAGVCMSFPRPEMGLSLILYAE